MAINPPKNNDLRTILKSLTKRVDLLERAPRLNSASISGGNLTVKDGGSIVVRAPGSLSSEYADGTTGVYFGAVVPNPPYEHGLLLQDSEGDLRIFFLEKTDGTYWASIGTEGKPLDNFDAKADNIYMESPNDEIHFNAGGELKCRSAGNADLSSYGGGNIIVDTLGQTQVGLNSSAVFIGHTTTGSAANTRLETSGLIQRVTSSLRYKKDVRNADISVESVLSIEGRTWTAIGDDSDEPKRYIGFIAEELDDAGLTEFIDYDEEGRPDSIQYDRLSVALLSVLKAQQAQIDQLTTRLNDIDGKGI